MAGAAHRAAESAEHATAFIQQSGQTLLGRRQQLGRPSAESRQLQQLVDRIVDVDRGRRFCLGRYLTRCHAAAAAQYLQLFHQLLFNNITSKIGDYQGVSFTVAGRCRAGR